MTNKQLVNIPVSEVDEEDKYKVLFVQGRRVQIQRGEDVEVRPIVKDILQESNTLKRKGNRQEKPLALKG